MTASANQRPDHDRFPIPISRFHTRPQPQSHPLPPPPGTDVPSHEDADALDAWLDTWAQSQDEEVAAPSASHDARTNGQIASARQFHARLAAAEEAEAPETPVDAIWEQIMANTLIVPAQTPPPVPITAARSAERRPNRHPMLVAVASHPAATAVLVAGVILAIVLVFRTFAHDPHAPIIDYGPAANTGIASATATPGASPTASLPAAACTVTVMTDAEAQELVKNNARPRAASDYLPVRGQPLVSNADAQAALEAYRGLLSCERPPDVDDASFYLQRPSLMTDKAVAANVTLATPESVPDRMAENLALTKALSPALATPDPGAYIVDPTDPLVAPYIAVSRSDAGYPDHYLLPQDFVTLPDGRIGVPLKGVQTPPAEVKATKEWVTDFSPPSAQTVPFIIFKEVDGQWLVDDGVTLCVENCDAYYAEQERKIAELRSQYGSAAGSPTSAVSPVAVDRWLQPVTSADCTNPGTGNDQFEQAANLARQIWACGPLDPPLQIFSDDLLARHPEVRNGQYTLTAEDVAEAKAIAPIVAKANPTLEVTGIPTDNAFALNVGFYLIFLPQNAIMLDDGRVAIPYTQAYPDRPNATATPASSSPYTGVALYVFRMNGDTMKFDGFLATCIGECSDFWAQSERQTGTPVPSDDMIATMRAYQATPAASDATPTHISGGDNSRPTQTPTVSPEAIQLSTPDENGCIIRTLSSADRAAIANPAAMPTPDYTVAGPLNSETIARDATEMLSATKACTNSQQMTWLPENQRPGALSNAMLATSQLHEMPDTRIALDEQRLARDKRLSTQLVVQDPTRYIVDGDDPAVKPWLLPHYYAESTDGAMLPQDFVTFGDGRIGAPLKFALPGGPGAAPKVWLTGQQTLIYVFFRQVDGVWLIDEMATLCTQKCDQYFASRQQGIDADSAAYRLSTPAVAASPAGAPTPDIWLQPITQAECETAIATPANEHDAAAILMRQNFACAQDGTIAPDLVSQVYSIDFLQRHPEMRDGQYTLSADDVAQAETMSLIVAATNPQIIVTGLPGADDDSRRTDGFYEVFLPDRNAIPLSDGRFAIPMSLAFPTEARTNEVATAAASGTEGPYTVAVFVFTMQEGSPRIDDQLLVCLANCDTFWEQLPAKVGTPVPSSDEIATRAATATAIAEAKQPIPASACVVPTVTGEQDLPDRAYSPLLKPTDANATAVSQNARAFISCIEDSATEIDAPPARIRDVVAPFETQRRRAEDAAADPSVPVQPTDAQIDAGKRISAHLEAQGVTTFAERAPDGVVDPGDSSWPGTMQANGQLADTTPGWYIVPMPGVAVQLGDGRIGIPMMQLVTNDDLWALHQEQSATQSGSLWVFAKVGDQWLMDEGIALCIGDCDAYWSQLATPLPSDEWLRPVQASDCVPVSASTYREYVRPRDYTIVNTASRPDVARQSRTLAACSPDGGLGMPSTVRSQFETARAQKEAATGTRLTDEQIAAAKEFSATYAERSYRVYQRAPEGVDVTALPFTLGFVVAEGRITYTIVYLPDEAVTLSDGRVAIPSTWLISDDASWSVAMQQPYQQTHLTIWANIDGTWLIDETLPLCIGNCTAYWDQVAANALGTPAASTASSPTSPPATPVAPPAADIWHQPIAASECVPVPAAANHDDDLPRDYAIASNPAADGQGAAQQSRARTACLGWGTVTPQAATTAGDFATARHATEDTRRLSSAQIAGAKDISSAYTEAGFRPYQRAPQGMDFRDVHTMTTQRADEGPIVYTPIFDPATAVELGDGRIAIPTTYLIADDRSWNQAQGQPLPITTALTIWANVDGTWLVDEELPLCIGDCHALWAYLESRAPDAPATTPSTPASPHASASQDDRWLRQSA